MFNVIQPLQMLHTGPSIFKYTNWIVIEYQDWIQKYQLACKSERKETM